MKLSTCCITAAILITLCSANTYHPKVKKIAHWYISHYENVLGTSLELKISATSQKEATTAEAAALNEISRLGKILSGYDAASEFSVWLRTSQQPIHVSPELFEVMNLFDEWSIRSRGALNPSAEVINRLWKQSVVDQHLPTKEELSVAIAEAQQSKHAERRRP